MITNENEILELLPSRINSSEEILNIIKSGKIKSNHIALIKSLIYCNNTIIAYWLDIDVKMYRKCISSETDISNGLQERLVMLLALIKHGIDYWGTETKLKAWLSQENFYLDGTKPLSLLNTFEGIMFIDNMLTGMEYGDNA
jgi:uncharacterized protein (DUF2384 family)